jgi:hypothetical protein
MEIPKNAVESFALEVHLKVFEIWGSGIRKKTQCGFCKMRNMLGLCVWERNQGHTVIGQEDPEGE